MDRIGPFIFLALTAYGAWTWRRSRLRVPRFVHALGLFGLAVGGWMVWLDTTVGEFTWRRGAIEILMMPCLVYAGFFAYSIRLRAERAPEEAPVSKAAPGIGSRDA